MKEKILMTHIYWGDPSGEFSLKLAKTLDTSGADILEIGVPYTDPICDGDVFQRACSRALANGATPFKVIDGIKQLRNIGVTKPIYLTSYYGPIFKIGADSFVKRAVEARVNGLIVPDILLEEQGELRKACDRKHLSLIQFATIYSTRERLKKICQASRDFIYCISLPGVTGDRVNDKDKLKKLIQQIQSITSKKIYVGFGIDSSQKAKEILGFGSEGVIVGSAIIRSYDKEGIKGVDAFIKDLKAATIV